MTAHPFTQANCESARAEAYAGAVLDERLRIVSILSLPEAESRFEVAKQLALTPDMASETARQILLRVPVVAQRIQHTNPFAQAMAALSNPDVCGSEGPSHLDAATDGVNADTVARRIAENVKAGGSKQ